MKYSIVEKVRKEKPLIHCITNYVTAGSVANMILAAGASPVMADGIFEVREVALASQALVLNMGTLKENTVSSMITAGKTANAQKKPVIFDPVGAASSSYRAYACKKVLEHVKCALIRGNASEIKALIEENKGGLGVDVSHKDLVREENLEAGIRLCLEAAKAFHTAVLMTGNIDISVNNDKVILVRNGHTMMKRITGAGCMLDGLAAAFLAVSDPEDYGNAAALAAAAEGLCGEIAFKRTEKDGGGTGSYTGYLIDAVSLLTGDQLRRGGKIEIR